LYAADARRASETVDEVAVEFAAALVREDLVYGLKGDSFIEPVLHAGEADSPDL